MVLKRDRWWGQFGELCRLSQRLVDWHASRLYRRDTANRQRLDTLVNETDHMLLLGWWKERKGLGRLCRTPRPSPGGATQTDRPLPRLLSAVTGHTLRHVYCSRCCCFGPECRCCRRMLTWLKRKEKLAPEPEPAVAAQKTTKEQNKGFEKGSVVGSVGELCRLSQRLGDWHA